MSRIAGRAMLLTAAFMYAYYTIWAIVLPFFDESSPVHGWFPPREWAVRIPAFILVLGISAVSLFLGTAIIQHHKNSRSTQASHHGTNGYSLSSVKEVRT